MSFSNYLEDEILDAVCNNGSFAVAQPWVSLHDGDPGETGANEITGGSYGRQSASFAAASGGSCASDATLDFTTMPSVPSLTHVGMWDASTAGNFLVGGSLTAAKTVNAGDTFRLASGNLVITCD